MIVAHRILVHFRAFYRINDNPTRFDKSKHETKTNHLIFIPIKNHNFILCWFI